jgi:predicted lipoprotein
MKIKILTPLFLLSFVTLFGCQNNQPKVEVSPAGLQQVVTHSADVVIIPSIQAWKNASNQFYEASQNFCKTPNSTKLIGLQKDWKQLSLQWNQVIMYDFGPLRDNLFSAKVNFVESMRQRGKNYASTVRSRLKQRLNDTKKLDKAYFQNLNFNLVGMTALELMVFSDFSSKRTDPRSILNNYRKHPRSCQLLIGMSRLNNDIAAYVLNGWQKKHQGGGAYRDLFARNQLVNGEKSLTKLVFAMQDYFRYIKQRKLTGRLDATLSGMTYTNMSAGIDGMSDLFNAKGDSLSLQNYLLAAGKKKVVDDFVTALNTAKLQAKLAERESMSVSYSKLTKMLEKDIPLALGVDFGMNFTDGD